MSISDIIYLIVQVIGSLALFLFGMKYMSEALQRITGSGLRRILTSFTSNRFKAALTGTFITAAVQSSSATTVMVVGFVNAGLLSLTNAIGVIMGSNIGTTVTAWIITLFGIKFDISSIAIPVVGLGFIFMMIKNKKVKPIGEFFIGFGLLFLGLTLLKASIEDLDLANNAHFVSFISGFVSNGSVSFGHVLLFVLIGTLLTIVLQSSSAVMALTIVLCSQGAIPFEIAVALVLGENIGTTVTANIASMVGNISAKRAARSHFIFNVIGVIWVLIFFRYLLSGIDWLTQTIEGDSPYVSIAAIPIALSLFHTCFNVLNTSILIWFVDKIEKLTFYMVKKDAEDEVFKLKYIDSGFMKVGELAVESAKKELQIFAQRINRMYEFIPQLLEIKDKKEYNNLIRRTEHYEEVSDKMEFEIANYLTNLSTEGLASKTALRIRGMLRVVDNLESIGDQNYQLAKSIDLKNEQHIVFSKEMLDNLSEMFNLVRNALQVMEYNLNVPYNTVEITEALTAENKINEFRNRLREQHLLDLENNVYNYQTGIAYSGIYALLEKIGDHAINISEAIVNAKYTKDESILHVEEITLDDN